MGNKCTSNVYELKRREYNNMEEDGAPYYRPHTKSLHEESPDRNSK